MADDVADKGGNPKPPTSLRKDAAERVDRFKRLTDRIADSNECDVLFFAGDIFRESLAKFVATIRSRKTKRKNVLLFLTTNGGDAHCAYRIVNRLQQSYPNGEVTIFVHSTCASAGTLMVIGGHNVVMSDSAELGPLDIQLAKTDDLVNRMSGVTPSKAMATLRQQALSCFEDTFLRVLQGSGFRISVRTASEIAVSLTTGLYQPIYGQIDPFRLGEVQRDNEIALKYGLRLNRGNLRDGALQRLIDEYPAHEFVINRAEAKEHIFHRVRPPNEEELALADFLEQSIERSLSDEEPTVAYLCRPLEPDQKEENKNEDENDVSNDKTNQGQQASLSRGTRARGARPRNQRPANSRKTEGPKDEPEGTS